MPPSAHRHWRAAAQTAAARQRNWSALAQRNSALQPVVERTSQQVFAADGQGNGCGLRFASGRAFLADFQNTRAASSSGTSRPSTDAYAPQPLVTLRLRTFRTSNSAQAVRCGERGHEARRSVDWRPAFAVNQSRGALRPASLRRIATTYPGARVKAVPLSLPVPPRCFGLRLPGRVLASRPARASGASRRLGKVPRLRWTTPR